MDRGKIGFIGVSRLSSAKIRGHDTSSPVMQDNVVHGRSCPLIFAPTFQVIKKVDLSKIRTAETSQAAIDKCRRQGETDDGTFTRMWES